MCTAKSTLEIDHVISFMAQELEKNQFMKNIEHLLLTKDCNLVNKVG